MLNIRHVPVGETLTLTRAPEAGRVQLWEADGVSTGVVRFASSAVPCVVYPEWWGAVTGDAVAANQGPIRQALLSLTARGGTVELGPGTYYCTDTLELLVPGCGSVYTITLKGTGNRSTVLMLSNASPTNGRFLSYNNTGGSQHRLDLQGLSIEQSATASVELVSWHSAVGIYCAGGPRESFWRDLYVATFTTGIELHDLWNNVYEHVLVYRCLNGVTVAGYHNNTDWRLLSLYKCGSSAGEGVGMSCVSAVSLRLTHFNAEEMKCNGLVLENCRGVVVQSAHFEGFTNARAIALRGLTGSPLADTQAWTEAVVIDGCYFWNALGVHISSGVRQVEMCQCVFSSGYPSGGYVGYNSQYGLAVASGTSLLYVEAIEYHDNAWLLAGAPTLHFSASWYPAFLERGRRLAPGAEPGGTGFTYQYGEIVWNRESAAPRGWQCIASGTTGTLAGVTGSITSGTNTLVVSTLSGLRTGQLLSIAGAGAAGAALLAQVILVNETTLTLYLSPNASTTVAGAAVSYSAPSWAVLGDQEQSVDYAASITPDFALGSLVRVGTLTGNVTINNPTNPPANGERVRFYFLTDGTGRTLTWDTNYRAATTSITANHRVILEFVSVDSVWYQVGTAQELS